jgi:hypothetical protein
LHSLNENEYHDHYQCEACPIFRIDGVLSPTPNEMPTRAKSSRKIGAATIVSLVTISLTALAGACSSNDSDGGSDASADAYVDAGRIAFGGQQVVRRGCTGCHNPPDPETQGIMSGQTTPRPGTQTYPANLTPDDDFGIGTWTDDQVFRAITLGIDKNDVPLCFTMPRAGFDTYEIYSMILYLKSLPPIHRQIPTSSCPPLKPRPDAGADASTDAENDAATEPEDSGFDAENDAD